MKPFSENEIAAARRWPKNHDINAWYDDGETTLPRKEDQYKLEHG